MKKIIAIVGARPQFIKHFPLEKASKGKIELITIHTGQHYDTNMSEIFFDQLGMNKPHYMLNIGSGNHGIQTANMMIEIESVVEKEKPDGMIVYGDTNSTLAGALVASKLQLPIFHIEAGLRSFNRGMPEEINRVLTDHISELLFVPSELAKKNLQNEGLFKGVHVVGDIMKDLVLYCTQNELVHPPKLKQDYYYATLHRPYNTDDIDRLSYVLKSLNCLKTIVVMAIHPRTDVLMKTYGLKKCNFNKIKFINPQSYFDNLSYLSYSKGLITDSGGMQKEAYWLKKQCVTVRTETEWVETLLNNWNTLVFEDLERLNDHFEIDMKDWNQNLYGSGNTSSKIIDLIIKKN